MNKGRREDWQTQKIQEKFGYNPKFCLTFGSKSTKRSSIMKNVGIGEIQSSSERLYSHSLNSRVSKSRNIKEFRLHKKKVSKTESKRWNGLDSKYGLRKYDPNVTGD